MKYFISENTKPAYLQLYEQIRSDIISGAYVFGSKLPSKRIMAEETGLSVITIEHAYALLYEEGYLESKQKSGYFVCFRPAEFFINSNTNPELPQKSEVKLSPHDFSIQAKQDPSVYEFPFSVLAKTMRSVLSDFQEEIFTKSPNKGNERLRKSLSLYLLRSRGISVLPEQIIIGSGSEYLYSMIAEMLGKDRIYAIEDPSYEKIGQVYQSLGATCEFLPLRNGGIDSAALTASKASVLHVTPYRSFPSGITANASKRQEYIFWAKNRQGFLIEDDYFSEFTTSHKPEDTLFSLSKGDNVIYLNTFSKTISRSLRAGYMVLPVNMLPLYEKKVGFYSCTVPSYEQLVISRLIDSGEFERHINRVRRQKRKNGSLTM